MKHFFRNKTNVILIIILIILLGAGGFFAYNVLKEPTVKAIDFSNMTETEIVSWAKENGVSDKIEFKHEFDDSIKKGYVIYQSIKEGDDITNNVVIIISDGSDKTGCIDIPIDNFKTKDEIEAWFKENNFINVTFEFVEGSDMKDYEIISVDPISAKPEDKVVVKVASGTLVEVPDLSHYSDEEINAWSKENNIKVIYEYKTSESAKGAILSQSVKAGEKVSNGSSITLTISSGNASTATIPGNYLGIEESKFISNLKELGFTNLKKDEVTYYSVTSKKGTIFSYDDGTFPTTQTIKYAISEGKYELNSSAFNDQTLTKAKELVDALNKRNAHITFKTTDSESDSHTKGTVYDCTSSFDSPNTTISCKYAKDGKESSSESSTPSDPNATAYISEYGYLGVSESEFTTALKNKGFTKLTKIDSIYSTRGKGQICYYLPDGDQKLSTEIKYKVSLGTFADEVNGKTLSEAKKLINAHDNISLRTTSVNTSSYPNDTVYNCTYSNSMVSCSLAVSSGGSSSQSEEEDDTVTVPSITNNPCSGKDTCSLNGLKYVISYKNDSSSSGTVLSVSHKAGSVVKEGTTVYVSISKGPQEESKAYIDAASAYRSTSLSYHTVEDTKNYIQGILGGFDLSFDTDTDINYDTGTIISISVDGTTSYAVGNYPLSTKVVVKISSGRK